MAWLPDGWTPKVVVIDIDGTITDEKKHLSTSAVHALRRLEANGIEVRPEAAPGSGELFPHLYGPLPLDAICLVERW